MQTDNREKGGTEHESPMWLLKPFNESTSQVGGGGGGVLRYISDGDVRSPFLGLKFAI